MTYEPSTSPATTLTTHSLAIVSLVLSILGLVGVRPLIGSIGAIIAGGMARKEIAAQPHTYTGENLAQAGLVLGWVGAVLVGLVLCAALLVFFFLVPATIITSR
jgi:hypothetical protein